MWKVGILVLILLYICWSLYTIYIKEGFQASGGPAPMANCDVLLATYKTLEKNYNKALADNNEIALTSAAPAFNLIKNTLINMNCRLP
jgi:hypothetical protein